MDSKNERVHPSNSKIGANKSIEQEERRRRFQYDIENTIKSLELLFEVDQYPIAVGARNEQDDQGNASTENSEITERHKTTQFTRPGTTTLSFNIAEGKPRPQWRKGGLTAAFKKFGYSVNDKPDKTLVSHLFGTATERNTANNGSDLHRLKCNEEESFADTADATQSHYRMFRLGTSRFVSPRKVITKRKTNADDSSHEKPKVLNEKNNPALDDFCKKITGTCTEQSFTFNSHSFTKLKVPTNGQSQSGANGIQSMEHAEGVQGISFVTAYEKLVVDDKAKGIKRSRLPPPSSALSTTNVHVSGLRKIPRVENKTSPQKFSKTDSEESSDNPEVQTLMQDERIKNIEPKMVEAILNEIIEVETNTHWDDIAGLHGPKAIIKEIIIWPLQRPDIFTGLRGPPKGVLLFGPPGTGKTLIGRLIATESKSTFFNISASSLTSKWIGDGEKMVRALFQVARIKQPAVIFIDEIDSILTQRSDTEHESSRRLKTEFLIQFDGCATKGEDKILVIGVTNRPQELDEAARRRLVKRIYIPLPDKEGRQRLVQNSLKGQNFFMEDGDFDKIAELTEGYSGADMASLIREAAYFPIRDIAHDIENINVSEVRPIQLKDFVQAIKLVKASVATQDLTSYEQWDKQFGCQLAS